jgi:predicted esterase
MYSSMRARTLGVGLLLLALLIAGVASTRERVTARTAKNVPAAAVRPVGAAPVVAPPQQIFVDTLPVPGDQPVFVLRGAEPRGRVVGVALHGWCGHGMGVLQAFAFAAAKVGPFIALQGNAQCGQGALRGWSIDPVANDRRIDAALRAYLGEAPPPEVVLVGLSQGAEVAVALARRFPDKYKRLVLGSGPRVEPPIGLRGLSGAYFLVGQHEHQAPTRETAQRWKNAGLSVELQIISGAGHADFQGRGNPLLEEAFRFLDLTD